LFDLQTRYALGLEQLGEAHFELRTVYNFRERLSRYSHFFISYFIVLLVRCMYSVVNVLVFAVKSLICLVKEKRPHPACKCSAAGRMGL
ncbi:MAG: hypothetical protein SVR81_07955, partial [Chloroflexota bacterium]|nr:hypothetical protein [Chloroflexota bacterium]